LNVFVPFPSLLLDCLISLFPAFFLFSLYSLFSPFFFAFFSIPLLRRGSGWLRKMFTSESRIVQRMRWVRQLGYAWNTRLKGKCYGNWTDDACPFFLYLLFSPYPYYAMPWFVAPHYPLKNFTVSYCISYVFSRYTVLCYRRFNTATSSSVQLLVLTWPINEFKEFTSPSFSFLCFFSFLVLLSFSLLIILLVCLCNVFPVRWACLEETGGRLHVCTYLCK